MVAHLIPGRIRLNVPETYRSPSKARGIQQHFISIKGIKITSANIFTGRILICFDSDQINPDHIIKELEQVREEKLTVPMSWEQDHVHVVEPEDASIPTQALRLVLIGAGLLALVVRRITGRPTFLSSSPVFLLLNSGVIIISAYPVFRSGLNSLFNKWRINHDLLLGTASCLLFFLRQDILGLWVLWLTYLSAYIQRLVLRNSELQLKEIIKSIEESFSAYTLDEAKTATLMKKQAIAFNGVIEEGTAIIDEAGVTGQYPDGYVYRMST